MMTSETKTVRVAVVINKNGSWHAFGKSGAKDAALRYAVAGFKEPGGRIRIVEVPIPELVDGETK